MNPNNIDTRYFLGIRALERLLTARLRTDEARQRRRLIRTEQLSFTNRPRTAEETTQFDHLLAEHFDLIERAEADAQSATQSLQELQAYGKQYVRMFGGLHLPGVRTTKSEGSRHNPEVSERLVRYLDGGLREQRRLPSYEKDSGRSSSGGGKKDYDSEMAREWLRRSRERLERDVEEFGEVYGRHVCETRERCHEDFLEQLRGAGVPLPVDGTRWTEEVKEDVPQAVASRGRRRVGWVPQEGQAGPSNWRGE